MSLLQYCAAEEAQRALANMKKKGFCADPNDVAHVQAYVAMRAFTHRVKGPAFEDYMNNQVKEVGTGAKVSSMFWAVPKVNFAHALPEWLAPSVVDDRTLETMELAGGGNIDRETYHVIDQEVGREKLGNNVLTLEIFMRSSSSCRVPAAIHEGVGDVASIASTPTSKKSEQPAVP